MINGLGPGAMTPTGTAGSPATQTQSATQGGTTQEQLTGLLVQLTDLITRMQGNASGAVSDPTGGGEILSAGSGLGGPSNSALGAPSGGTAVATSTGGGPVATATSGGAGSPLSGGGTGAPSLDGGIGAPSLGGGSGTPSLGGGAGSPLSGGGTGAPSLGGGAGAPGGGNIGDPAPIEETLEVPPSSGVQLQIPGGSGQPPQIPSGGGAGAPSLGGGAGAPSLGGGAGAPSLGGGTGAPSLGGGAGAPSLAAGVDSPASSSGPNASSPSDMMTEAAEAGSVEELLPVLLQLLQQLIGMLQNEMAGGASGGGSSPELGRLGVPTADGATTPNRSVEGVPEVSAHAQTIQLGNKTVTVGSDGTASAAEAQNAAARLQQMYNTSPTFRATIDNSPHQNMEMSVGHGGNSPSLGAIGGNNAYINLDQVRDGDDLPKLIAHELGGHVSNRDYDVGIGQVGPIEQLMVQVVEREMGLGDGVAEGYGTI